MHAQLTQEKEADESTYHKLMCWIETNMAQNEEIITKTSAEVNALHAFLEQGTGQIRSLTQEKEVLNAEKESKGLELKDFRAALATQKEDLNQEISRQKKNIKALKGALVALGAGNGFNQKEVREQSNSEYNETCEVDHAYD